jgi:chorismate synthase
MALRRPSGKISTARVEKDEYKIVSGEYNGFTTGTPLTVIIPNTNVKSTDYDRLKDTPRPSHADYTAEMKYCGYQDPRGGGHFSGRITAPLVFAGALIGSALESKGIYIGTHISNIRLTTEVEDNSDIPERLISGQFTRLTIGIDIDDAYLFDVRIRDNLSIVEGQLWTTTIVDGKEHTDKELLFEK